MDLRTSSTNSTGSLLNHDKAKHLISWMLAATLLLTVASPVVAQDQGDTEAKTLDEVVVEAERKEEAQKGGGYLSEPDASSNLGLNLQDANNPFSTTSVGEQVIEDQDSKRFGEVSENIPGVFEGRSRQKFSNFVSRGYLISNRYGYLRNGLRFSHLMEIPMANVAKVEANKGPSSILNAGGSGSNPAGSLNIVTKKPLDRILTKAAFNGDQHGGKQVQVDYNVPVSEDFQYRINAAYDNSEEFWDFGERDVRFISGVGEYTLFDGSKVTLDMQYTDREEVIYPGLPVLNNGSAQWADRLPISRFIGFPDYKGQNENFITQLKYDKDLTENLTFNLNGHYQYRKRIRNNLSFNPVDANGDGTEESVVVFPASFGFYNSRRFRYILRGSLSGNHEGPYFDHNWVLGTEFEDFSSDFSNFVGGNQADGDTINVFNPDYSNLSRNFPDKEWTYFGKKNSDFQHVRSAYFQDQLTGKGSLDGLTTVVGLRYDEWDGSVSNSNAVAEDDGFSPRFGVLYRPPSDRSISYYGNYSTSITPTGTNISRGNQFDPEKGIQREIGLKKRWYEGELSLNASYYFNTFEDRVVSPPSGPDEQVGEEESKGVELDLRGNVTPQTTIIANYAYNQAEVTEDADPARVGQDLSRTSDNQASLWTKYSFVDRWEGIDVGGGVNWVDDRRAAFSGALDIPSRLIVDAMIAFQPNDRLKAQFNVKNLLDQRYYLGSNSSSSVYPGQPLTLSTSISYKF